MMHLSVCRKSIFRQTVRLRETHADTEIALAVNLQTHKNEFSCVCKRIQLEKASVGVQRQGCRKVSATSAARSRTTERSQQVR